jgi:hypothetical protein
MLMSTLREIHKWLIQWLKFSFGGVTYKNGRPRIPRLFPLHAMLFCLPITFRGHIET